MKIRYLQAKCPRVHHLLDVRIKRGRKRRCVQPFFVEHLLSRWSRSLMRPFSHQLTPWFALPMPVFREPTCGRLGVKERTNQAGKLAMNGWAWLRILAQRPENSSAGTGASLPMTSVMAPVNSVAKDLIA